MIKIAVNEIINNLKQSFTPRTFVNTIVGNIILGIGIAILRVSSMGTDSFSAMTMAVSQILSMDLGMFHFTISVILLIVQLLWGRKYIGLGTLINMVLLGYIVQYAIPVVEVIVGKEGSLQLEIQLLMMLAGLIIVAFGLAVYQRAKGGVSPYDFLSMKLTDILPTPYFCNRIITDATCVLVSLSTFLLGFQEFSQCHLGVATIINAFFLGPLVGLFNKIIRDL